jgi:acyl transferase domain-containing protein
VKTNIGHLDTAAGIAGLIKTVLMLKHQTLVPSLHFSEPNPAIDFESSPFFVQSRTAPWVVREAAPRRAGVSAFGIGGTNAHVILEEAPGLERASAPPRPELILISAKSAAQLDEATLNLAKHLRRYPDLALGDVAFTLSTGRQHHAWRRVVIGADTREVALSLALVDPEKVITRESISTGRGVTYLLNDSRRDIAASVRKLWQSEPVFRQHFAECAHEAPALREFDASGCSRALRFAATYACARLFLSMGIQPSAIKASGAGELVAACLAGSLSLAEALGAVEQYEADQPHIAEDELAEPGAAITLDVNEALESIPRALGSLWLLGLDIAWERCFEGREARRVPLPTYVFQRQRYWVDEQGAAPAEATNQSKSELARQVNEASGSARVRILSTHLQKQIAGMLGLPASELPDIHQSFMELKLESLTLIEIVTRLSGELSLTIPASALVEFPTIAAFSSRVTELWDGASGSQSIAETAPLAETDARRAALEDQRRRRRNTRMSSIEA